MRCTFIEAGYRIRGEHKEALYPTYFIRFRHDLRLKIIYQLGVVQLTGLVFFSPQVEWRGLIGRAILTLRGRAIGYNSLFRDRPWYPGSISRRTTLFAATQHY